MHRFLLDIPLLLRSFLAMATALATAACAPASDAGRDSAGATQAIEADARAGSATDSSAGSSSGSTPAARAGSATWTARADGVGPLRVGMSPAQVRAAVRVPGGATLGGDSCTYARLPGPPRLNVMITQGTLARVDVRDTSVHTAEGARVLQPADSVKALYAGRLEERPHKYSRGWSYLVVAPPGDSTHRIVFESDGNVVVSYRVGRRPEVEWVEGCS